MHVPLTNGRFDALRQSVVGGDRERASPETGVWHDAPMLRVSMCTLLLAWILAGAPAAWAVPGPESVVVVANSTVAESVALAERYASARDLPPRQVCRLELPATSTIDFDTYEREFLGPLEDCLDDGGITERLEALVLAKGVPLRVGIPTAEGGVQRASLAAVVAAWKSTTLTGRRLVGSEPGRTANCGGTPCLAARHPNPFREGVFAPGWSRSTGSVIWRPLLVTALEGRSHADAAKLVASATTAEAQGGATGDFVFMRGRDPARAVLDPEFPALVSALERAGLVAEIVAFDSDLEDRDLAAFFVGTASLGRTIEGNRYRPGALVDNLTSFGAVPVNFEASGESQVSIARWVAMGVAGAHGTTDEPLNNVFPSRRLIVDYVEGGTLGEAYFRHLPFAYWRNLVLGDPMAAPYAVRPTVEIRGVGDDEVVVGARTLEITAADPLGRGIGSLRLFVDGVLVDEVAGDRMTTCLVPPEMDQAQLLAVAQALDDGTTAGFHQPKGWTAIRFDGMAGADDCATDDAGPADVGRPDAGEGSLDAGPPDAGRDAEVGAEDVGSRPDAGVEPRPDAGSDPTAMPVDEGGGCRGVSTSPSTLEPWVLWGVFMTAAARRRRARRRA